jgi:hypothetical protein
MMSIKDEKTIILVRAAALCQAILRCRNYIIFNKIKYSSFMLLQHITTKQIRKCGGNRFV